MAAFAKSYNWNEDKNKKEPSEHPFSEVMKPMATPTVGGLITATLSNLILVPVLYSWIKERQLKVSA